MRVAYYAHHHGSGHVRHALNLARVPSLEMMIMTSRSGEVDLPSVKIVPLPMDLVDNFEQPPGSPFLYSPSGKGAENVRQRFRVIHDALTDFQPEVVVVDVSPEVASFAKLAGYAVLVRRMPGDRNDVAHQVMYEMADGIVAYYPETLEQDDYPSRFKAKTTYVGMLSPVTSIEGVAVVSKTVAVLTSLGGEGVHIADVNAAAHQTPDWEWRVLGVVSGDAAPAANVEVLGTVGDPSGLLQETEVIVTSAGHNAIAAAAAAQRPIVVIPEPRPFNEQLRFAQMLSQHAGAVMAEWNCDWQTALSNAVSQPALIAKTLFVEREKYEKNYLDALERASSLPD